MKLSHTETNRGINDYGGSPLTDLNLFSSILDFWDYRVSIESDKK